jgi:hypothetical protein
MHLAHHAKRQRIERSWPVERDQPGMAALFEQDFRRVIHLAGFPRLVVVTITSRAPEKSPAQDGTMPTIGLRRAKARPDSQASIPYFRPVAAFIPFPRPGTALLRKLPCMRLAAIATETTV